MVRQWPLVMLVLMLAGCVDESAMITQCNPVGDRVPICGWQSPEDMELMGDGKTLIVSEMEQNHGEIFGRLSTFDTATGEKRVLSHGSTTDGEFWGSKSCTNPPGEYLAPHGIHLSQRSDGKTQLLVVNHGERESIEIYEVLALDGLFRLAWRGCAEAPPGAFLNDVVALPDGGFVATHMFNKPDSKVGTLSWAEIMALAGFNPGHLLHWDQKVFNPVPGFSGDYPNGLQISESGDYLFINSWAASKVSKFSWHDKRVIAETHVPHPDNSQWSDDGKLLIASHDFSLGDLRLCLRDGTKPCPGEFRVVSLDPDSMQSQVRLQQRGAPMGAGTIVQQVGNQWYIGSFLGDRMLKLNRP